MCLSGNNTAVKRWFYSCCKYSDKAWINNLPCQRHQNVCSSLTSRGRTRFSTADGSGDEVPATALSRHTALHRAPERANVCKGREVPQEVETQRSNCREAVKVELIPLPLSFRERTSSQPFYSILTGFFLTSELNGILGESHFCC